MNKKHIIPILFISLIFFITDSCNDDIKPESRVVSMEDLVDGEILFEINPYGIAPLTAMATFQTRERVRANVEVLGEETLIKDGLAYQTSHQLPVLGLYPDQLNKVVIKLTGRQGDYAADTFEIQSDTIPSFFPDISIITADTDMMEPGWNLCCLAIGLGEHIASYPIIFDSHGKVRWYLAFSDVEKGWITPAERLGNGNMFFGCGETIYEYSLLGKQENTWSLKGYSQTHDIIEKPDGNFLIPVHKYHIGTIDDHIIELDRKTGEIINEWDLRNVMDVDRSAFVNDSIDWLHINSVWYSPEDNCLIISGRNQGSVIKVNYENDPVWILAPHKGWEQSGMNGDGFQTTDYLLTALNSEGLPYPNSVQSGDFDADDFSWVWGQHAAMYLPNGNILIFDNGLHRNYSNNNRFSRGVEYEVDEQGMTLKQIWSYGKERGREFFSSIISDVDYLPETGNRFITAGIISGVPAYSTIVEVTYPENTVVFEARLTYKNMLVQGSGWGAFDFNYRAERTKIYPGKKRGYNSITPFLE